MCLSKAHLVTITLDRRGIRSGELSVGPGAVCNPTSILTGKVQPGDEGNIILVKIRFRQKSKPKIGSKPSFNRFARISIMVLCTC